MKMQRLKLSELKRYPGNPRSNEATVETLMTSIKRYGYQSPIVVDQNHVIVVGDARYQALQKMKVKQVDVVVVDLTEDQSRQLRIAENKTSELAEWDLDRLLAEIREVSDPSFLKELFAQDDLEKLVQESGQLVESEDIAKASSRVIDKYTEKEERKLVTLKCQHCHASYMLDREELRRKRTDIV